MGDRRGDGFDQQYGEQYVGDRRGDGFGQPYGEQGVGDRFRRQLYGEQDLGDRRGHRLGKQYGKQYMGDRSGRDRYGQQYEQDRGDRFGRDRFGQQFGEHYVREQDMGNRFGQRYGDQFGQTLQGQGYGDGQSTVELSQWGSSSFYCLRNARTGMFLAAHKDGQLVAEDDTTEHHDVPWRIYSTGYGRVALKSSHGKYLDFDYSSGIPTNNARDPDQATWELLEQGQGMYSLSPRDGRYLQAVEHNAYEQQVFLSNQRGQSESWQLEPVSKLTGIIDEVLGKIF